MPEIREFRYPSARTAFSIYARVWLPDAPPRAVVQLVHGVAEHVGRYAEIADFLSRHGFLVCGEDHLGHGKTVENGSYGFFAPEHGWELVVRDVRRLREIMGNRYPRLPYILLGHSMGSFLARTYLILYPGTLDGVILSGTGQEPAPLIALGRALAGLECRRLGPQGVSPLVDALSLGAYNRRFRPNRTSADWISRDPAAVDAYLADPLCRSKCTASMFRDMLGGLQFIGKKSNLRNMDLDIPVLFLSGDRDPVGGMGRGVQKVRTRFSEAGCRDVTLKLYPGGRHEMFHEINQQEVFEDVLAWLEDKLPS